MWVKRGKSQCVADEAASHDAKEKPCDEVKPKAPKDRPLPVRVENTGNGFRANCKVEQTLRPNAKRSKYGRGKNVKRNARVT